MSINNVITYIIIFLAGFSLARLFSKFLRRLLQDFQLPTIARVISSVIEYSMYIIILAYILINIGIQNIVLSLLIWLICTLLLINIITYAYNNLSNIFTRPKVSGGTKKLTHVEFVLGKHEKMLVPNNIIGSEFPIEKLNPKSQPES